MLAARKTTYKIEVKQSISVSERADLTFHVHFYFLPLPSLILFHHIIVILHSEKNHIFIHFGHFFITCGDILTAYFSAQLVA